MLLQILGFHFQTNACDNAVAEILGFHFQTNACDNAVAEKPLNACDNVKLHFSAQHGMPQEITGNPCKPINSPHTKRM